MLEQLLQLDEQLFVALNGLGNPTWDDFWLFVTGKFSSLPLYVLLLILLFKKMGWKNTLLTLVLVAGMIAITDQLANLFKHGIARPRPCQEEHLKEVIRFVAHGCGRYGYFSAHAASSMALAVFLGLVFRKVYPNLVFLLLFWSVLVSYSRIYLGVHYPLDIITGMAIGALVAFGLFRLKMALENKWKL